MITFSRNGTQVIVNIDIDTNTTKTVYARIECNNELYAELLRDLIREKFANRLERIRRIEYYRGRRREKKQDWFYYGLDPDDYNRNK